MATDPYPDPTPSQPWNQQRIQRFWADLPRAGRISVMAGSVLAIAGIAIVMANSTDSISYAAGVASGSSITRDIHDQGGPAMSDSDIERGCEMQAQTASELPAVHWQGGVIPHSEFDADDYKKGCVDGSEKARSSLYGS